MKSKVTSPELSCAAVKSDDIRPFSLTTTASSEATFKIRCCKKQAAFLPLSQLVAKPNST